MKTLFILNDPPYGSERSYNGCGSLEELANWSGWAERVLVF